MLPTRILTGLSIAVAAGCSPSLPEPVVAAVEPDWGYNGENTLISVAGDNFYPVVEVDVREDQAHLDHQYQLVLEGEAGSFELEGVEVESYEELIATVPKGLPVGAYDLSVLSPAGGSSSLGAAFTVTDTRADRLAFDVDEVVWAVNEPFSVGIDLLNPEDDIVLQPFPIVVTITADSGLTDMEVEASKLDVVEQSAIDGGLLIRANMRAEEGAALNLTARTPETLTLTVVPDEDGSVVDEDSLLLSISAGPLDHVRVELPYSGYVAAVGEAFEVELVMEDEDGHELEDASGTLVLAEACGGYTDSISIMGRATAEVVVETATDGKDCSDNYIDVNGAAVGASDTFQVDPGPPAGYHIGIYPTVIEAGVDTLILWLTAEDDYGNVITDYGEAWEQKHGQALGVALEDRYGGLGDGFGEQECGPGFQNGILNCDAKVWAADADNYIVATGDDGVQGTSPFFDVTTSTLASIFCSADTGTFEAGEEFQLQVQPLDAYNNPLETNPSQISYVFSAEAGEVSCDWDKGLAPEGVRSFGCTATVAVESEAIEVRIDTLDPAISCTTDDFRVINAPLAQVVFDIPAGSEYVAGESFGFNVQASDAYGNPYLEGKERDVDLTDETGTLSVSSVEIDTAGLGYEEGEITTALEDDRIYASQGGVDLGSSEAFDVVHAELQGLTLAASQPWVFLGESLELEVVAVDGWGNPVTSFDEEVVVDAVNGSAESITIDEFEQGRGVGSMEFDEIRIAEELQASADSSGVSVSLTPIDVLDQDCGVEAHLTIDGASETSLCLVSGTVSASLDASGSSGENLLFLYDDDAGNDDRTNADVVSATYTEAGGYVVTLVAFDSYGCGDEARAVAYVGENDGEPVGPVGVGSQDSERTVGQPKEGITLVDFSARDCAGDYTTTGALLYVRTDLGEFTSGTTNSGEGLYVSLDKSGYGVATWSVASEVYGGESVIYAGRPDGIAYGTVSITVQGDDARPFVVDLEPRGSTDESIDSLSVSFSEAMRGVNFNTSNVTFSDSYGSLDLDDLDFDEETNSVSITLAEEADLSLDTYTLVLSDQVRDEAGNRLDGTWSVQAGPFTAQLGAVSDSAPDVDSCVPEFTTFRPDGDDQPTTEETDILEVDVSADATPDWWLLQVKDEQEEVVWTWWTSAASSSETLTWYGRGYDGIVMENGTYTIHVSAADAYLNTGEVCTTQISLDNHVVEPQ